MKHRLVHKGETVLTGFKLLRSQHENSRSKTETTFNLKSASVTETAD